ncbi:hypothetical protein [Actinomadura sp. WMMA1423]|uniref:hypothetical protein n=1 Tax=Actinomadura sp. WMMA1423 TaxID=2591108 RepID=UPI001146AFCD|nr:hypothetical protein [Actinomadura sp. WMMA1423]
MRFLIVLAELAVAVTAVVLLFYAFTGRSSPSRAQLESGARWETHTESSDGVTTVVVRRVSRGDSGDVLAETGRQTVAAIPDADPQWEDRYHEAMAQARSRVAALESETD